VFAVLAVLEEDGLGGLAFLGLFADFLASFFITVVIIAMANKAPAIISAVLKV
jgi:hypothetical protein